MGPQDTEQQILLRNYITGVIENSTSRETFSNPDSKSVRDEGKAFAIFTYADSNIIGTESNMAGVSGGPDF